MKNMNEDKTMLQAPTDEGRLALNSGVEQTVSDKSVPGRENARKGRDTTLTAPDTESRPLVNSLLLRQQHVDAEKKPVMPSAPQ